MKSFIKTYMRVFGLLAFIATGGGLVLSTIINEENFYKTEILIIIGGFFAISLMDHYKKLVSGDDDNKGK